MDIQKYQSSIEFSRNESIFVFHTVNNHTLEELAANFNLAVEEIVEIIEMHKQYVAAIA
jgi:hypothetical protein